MPSQTLYLPLSRNPNSVRLVTILPGEPGDRISCLLHVIDDLTSGPSYTALSYTWGDVHPQVEIRLDGEIYFVRENLWYALQRLRDPPIQAIAESSSICYSKDDFPVMKERSPVELDLSPHERYFFIDAMCINQEDVLERPSQVNLMGTIYSQAILVICWIGEASGNSDRIVQWLKCKTPEERKSYPECVSYGNKWGDLGSFFDRDYWIRLWIVQEILLANIAIILCGNAVCSWYDVCQDQSRLSSPPESSYYGNYLFVRKICTRLTFRGANTRLVDLIIDFSRQKCTLSQDKLFGLLGIIPLDVEKYGILLSADYDKPLREVFRGVFVCVKLSDSGYKDGVKRTLLERFARELGVEPLTSQQCEDQESDVEESWEMMEQCYFGKELSKHLAAEKIRAHFRTAKAALENLRNDSV